MILSKGEIAQAIAEGVISVDPPPREDQYSSTALDLYLGAEFLCWDREKMLSLSRVGIDYSLDVSRIEKFSDLSKEYLIPAPVDAEGCHILRPGEFVLGITHEWVAMPLESRIAARVEGRSSLARMGLAIHLTAPTIHADWHGKIALEMFNVGAWPIKLRPYELKVCQLIFERVGGLDDSADPSHFQGQQSPAG